MPTKIRLSRHGRKKYAYYHIVVADSRAPRDGKFIERIGSYNPNTNPATIELDFDKALSWVRNGAQPTDTVRAILRYKGVLYKKHLLDGVKKGAFDEATAEEKFNKWLLEKESRIQSKKDRLAKESKEDKAKRLEAERKVKEARAQAVAEKLAAQASENEEAAAEETVENAEETAEQPEMSAENTSSEEEVNTQEETPEEKPAE
ncbi:MAG: 30S ribosomal protein S16 [Marinilabiliales bacterium]